MALPPRLAGQLLLPASQRSSNPIKHTLEVYLDYTCPFSAKMFRTLYTSVAPMLLPTNQAQAQKSHYGDKVNLIFRQHIQPWHPSSTLTHEAAVAVLRVAPACFWDFSAALFERQDEYFDVSVVEETRNQTYQRLAKLAGESVAAGGEGDVGGAGDDSDVEEKVMNLLRISAKAGEDGGLNIGNGVTDDIKRMVKAARVVGVHVSPTVFFDGVEEKGISSGFTKEQWEEWLAKNVT